MDRFLTRWTPERRERALAMWHSGRRTTEIAAELGVTPRAVRSIVIRLRAISPWVGKRRGTPAGAAWSADGARRLGEAWRAGEPTAAIARRHGRTVTAIRSRLCRLML